MSPGKSKRRLGVRTATATAATDGDPPRSGTRYLLEVASTFDWRFVSVGAVVGAVAAAGVSLVLALGPADAIAMVRDPAAVGRAGDPLPSYVGWISGAGVLLWAAASGLLALAAATSWRGRRRVALVHAVGAALTAFLATDDLLLLHDSAFPRYLGVPEVATQLGEVAVLAAWSLLVVVVLRDDPSLPVLGLALVLLAISVLHDVGLPTPPVHEEAAKFAGITCWTIWSWGSSRWVVARASVAPSVRSSGHRASVLRG